MYLRLSPDEESIKDIFVSFFDAECSIERIRNAEESGFDATAWERFIETGGPVSYTHLTLPTIYSV